MGNHRVRTTQRPTKVLTVDDAEFVDLKRQGLLVEDEPKSEDDEQAKAGKSTKPSSGSATKGAGNAAAIEGNADGAADTDETKGAGA